MINDYFGTEVISEDIVCYAVIVIFIRQIIFKNRDPYAVSLAIVVYANVISGKKGVEINLEIFRDEIG